MKNSTNNLYKYWDASYFMKKILFLLLLVFLFSSNGRAQQNDTANYPYWIEMMQDPSANFFQTQRAFELFWENKEVTAGCGYKPFKSKL